MGTSHQICLDYTLHTVSLLQSPGFVLNEEKSELVPTQKIVFLGFIVDSVRMSLALSQDKIDKIVNHCQDTLSATNVLFANWQA